MRSIPLNHHKAPAEANPILAAKSRKYNLRQRAAINIRPRLRNQEAFASVVPGSIGHPEFDPNTWSAFSIPRFLIKYKVLLISIASLVCLMGISTLFKATKKMSKASRSSVLPSYTRNKLAVDRLTQEHEANKARKKSVKVPLSTAAKDPASSVTTKTSILDTLNSMGLMEEKHTADSVGSVLLMVQDAEITSNAAATTDSLNSTEILGLEEEEQDYNKEQDYVATEKIQNNGNISHTTLMLMSPTEQQLAMQHQSQVKATVAYVITIQECNLNEPIWDGAAVLARSIIMNSIGSSSSSKTRAASKYGYKLFAIVHIDASTQEPNENEDTDHKTSDVGLSTCVENLAMLGYEVLIRDNPIHPHEIKNEGYLKSNVQDRIKDYSKLYAYTLTDYPIVVLLDVISFLLNPLDELFDAMLETSGSAEAKAAKEMINFHETGSNTFPDVIDAYFTRDYTTLQPTNEKAKVAGFQYGFLVIRPSNEVFDEILKIIEEGKYARDAGWGHKGYGSYLGAMTTKGLLSYYYDHVKEGKTSLELNRCFYNALSDTPRTKGDGGDMICRDGREECQDCRTADINRIRTVNMSVCRSPWKCFFHDINFNKNFLLCRQLERSWSEIRLEIENIWLQTMKDYVPSDKSGKHAEFEYLGYCNSIRDTGEGEYSPMKFPI